MIGARLNVHVVGVGHGMAISRPVPPPSDAIYLARSGERVLAGLSHCVEFSFAYDTWFDGETDGSLANRIADDVIRRARTAGVEQVMYFVPGPGSVGDATVHHLSQLSNVTFGASSLRSDVTGRAVQIVDALELAQAELSAPFDAGLTPLDPTMTVVVTNWYGEWVTRFASQRLERLHGPFAVGEVDQDGTLILPGADPLAGSASVEGLRQIYARLRRPDGCPWDREQTELTTVPHLVEEAEELREALENEDWVHAADELGDVLGNVIMIAQIAQQEGRFTFEDVVRSISEKLIRRHPHVFGDANAETADDVLTLWNQVKHQEREQASRAG